MVWEFSLGGCFGSFPWEVALGGCFAFGGRESSVIALLADGLGHCSLGGRAHVTRVHAHVTRPAHGHTRASPCEAVLSTRTNVRTSPANPTPCARSRRRD
eukprot:809210-Pleurochrysis_carterae.AAC.1